MSKQAKFVLLRPKLETVLAPVSYRSSRRRRRRKRLLLKVPIFNFTPSDLIHPRYCGSADARVRMQISLLLTALIQEWYLIKCDQKRTKPSPGWLSWERRVW